MNIGELIEKLQKFDKKSEILIEDFSCPFNRNKAVVIDGVMCAQLYFLTFDSTCKGNKVIILAGNAKTVATQIKRKGSDEE